MRSPFENYESLFSAAALASDRAPSMTNIPLTGDEKLVAGDVVGIDAEFVSLNQVCLFTRVLYNVLFYIIYFT